MSPTADRIAVSVRNVNYKPEDALILADMSFDARAGEILGIMGLSGAGKTSLLRLLIGLDKPESGEILIQGEDITKLGEDGLNRVRRKMGMCFQYAALFDSMTVAENVAFGLRREGKLSREEVQSHVEQMLDVVGMEGTEGLMPSELSGGMRKRIGVARALVTHPDIVLYDEPTAGLDPVIAAVISNLILHVHDEFGSTAVIVSHDVDNLLVMVDRALMLHEGRAIANGTPDELRSSAQPVVRQFIEGSISGPIQV